MSCRCCAYWLVGDGSHIKKKTIGNIRYEYLQNHNKVPKSLWSSILLVIPKFY